MFISVLMNELFRSSEFISFGVQNLVKAHINSKQCFFGCMPQPKQYVTCSQPDSAVGHTHISPTVVNEDYVRISEGQTLSGRLCMRILRAGFGPRIQLDGLDSCAFKDNAFFLCSLLTSLLQAGMGKLIQFSRSQRTQKLCNCLKSYYKKTESFYF